MFTYDKKTKKKSYWTKEKCHEEALKYNNKKDFINDSKFVYVLCSKNKWLVEVCSHMQKR